MVAAIVLEEWTNRVWVGRRFQQPMIRLYLEGSPGMGLDSPPCQAPTHCLETPQNL